ncbi:MAG: murA [Rickettsiales bacterium]|jgi:UDP-N-acetylglucosamine 1-carboxyvinyltransferase|nr:murA [Rickettsiales bacterium]
MDRIRIRANGALEGTIPIAGAKNAALPIMAASLLSAETLTLSNVPHLSDITTMAHLLVQHGVELRVDGRIPEDSSRFGRVIELSTPRITNKTAPYEIVRKMRASICVLGPLLARGGEAIVSLPGGCAIGARPVDLHLKALEQMGAVITLEDGYVHAVCPKGRLHGAEIHFEKISVGATENIMMAATLAEGKTVLHNAAQEPEVSDLAHCLIAMGAQIEGVGTNTITIHGKAALHGASHAILPDRIEAGTYAVAAAITGGDVELSGIGTELWEAVIQKLVEAGVEVTPTAKGLRIARKGPLKAVDIVTQPYPGFPTDMQAQFMALMTVTEGTSIIEETIFENRFMHVPELSRMGANIAIHGNTATVRGVPALHGAPVMATDLRASMSLVLAGLVAQGDTLVNRVYHIDRGYERIEQKLGACGASVRREKESQGPVRDSGDSGAASVEGDSATPTLH